MVMHIRNHRALRSCFPKKVSIQLLSEQSVTVSSSGGDKFVVDPIPSSPLSSSPITFPFKN